MSPDSSPNLVPRHVPTRSSDADRWTRRTSGTRRNTEVQIAWGLLALLILLVQSPGQATAQGSGSDGRSTMAAPPRAEGEGLGPFTRLVIRAATLIDGTGAPPRGPVDIVIEGNRIVQVRQAGWPGLPPNPDRAPHIFDHEIDASGMYVLPGFVDTHAHLPGPERAPNASYVYKLWLAHGVTTVRGVPLATAGLAASEKSRSAANEIVAPRIVNYQPLGAGWPNGPVSSAEDARQWVRWAGANGVDGVKFYGWNGETREMILAATDEARRQGLGTVAHLSQQVVSTLDARAAGEAGLHSITHFYGHMESLLKGRTIQDYPATYNFYNELDRFGEAAEIWHQTHEPGSDEWVSYLRHQRDRGVVFDPTLGIYAATRDLMRARNADWHQDYTMPQLWNFFQSTRENHGSFFYDWTSEREVAWRRFYERYFRLVNDYKNMGGRVTVGTDAGFIYKLYGFAYVEELEMLREAGFSPLEIIRSATMWGAEALYEPRGEPPPMGVVRPGMLADLVLVRKNPLQNLKILYGTGFMRLNETSGRQERVGGVAYTIKDGIVYDAARLLDDVAAMVAREKQAAHQSDEPRPVNHPSAGRLRPPRGAAGDVEDAVRSAY